MQSMSHSKFKTANMHDIEIIARNKSGDKNISLQSLRSTLSQLTRPIYWGNHGKCKIRENIKKSGMITGEIWASALLHKQPGGRLNTCIKMSSYQYRNPHVKDKTVSPTVLSLKWESPYLGKTVFILRRSPGSYPINSLKLEDAYMCLFWVKILIYALREILQYCMRYHIILDHVIMAPSCIMLNSLAPGGFDYNLKLVIFKLIPTINILSIFCEIAIRWMSQHLTDQ